MNKIVFITSVHGHNWNYFSLNGGLGGSESGLAYFADVIKKYYKNVVVFCEHKDKPTNCNGVEYRNYKTILSYDTKDIDTVVYYRDIEFVNIFKGSFKKILLLTDLCPRILNRDYTADNINGIKNINKFDNIIVLSDFHKAYLESFYKIRSIDITKPLSILGLPIDDKYIQKFKQEKIKNTFIYTSSKERGLDNLLENIWPVIYKNRPDAKLYVLCNTEKSNTNTNTNTEKSNTSNKNKYPGVIFKGRLEKEKMYKLLWLSEFFLYPCLDFFETFCISVQEAIVCECKLILSNYGSLIDQKHQSIMLPNPINCKFSMDYLLNELDTVEVPTFDKKYSKENLCCSLFEIIG